ncbi:TRAP transporter substrate-binding protein [Acuticoccus mangrovi]|uniref:TRAP transporter substrate-binding protein n=1 Tax=Acuticoccus mangrovi TaxID=2796142 RepID=A0A934IUP6_9HYPH|nr:TRAP transporter substrate-binding protein [Acuticoccus mangrovi]MBJ3778492.1 TRAP transporter substrate-binding protein [Acuticoccus mangrovi]
MKRAFTAATTAALLATATFAGPAAAKDYNWAIQSLWQAGTATQQSFERFAEDVAERTDGQIKIRPLPADAVVGTAETLEAVQMGVLDGEHNAPAYWTGREPGFAILGGLVGAYQTPEQLLDYHYENGGLELLQEAYEPFGLYPIGVTTWGAESLPLMKPVEHPDEFKGMKLRMSKGMFSDVFAKFGAIPIEMAGTEVYSALDKGVVDGADWGTLSMNEELGFHDIAKYAIYPGVHSMSIADVAIRKDVWDSLSPELQTTLKEAVRAFADDMVATMAQKDAEAAEKLTAEGVTLIDWSDEDKKAFREAAVDVWKAYATRSEFAQRALESQLDYMKKIGLIDD